MLVLQFKQTNQFLNYLKKKKKSNMLLLKFCLSLLFL